MKNLEKLGYSENENVDEIAVNLLLERIRDDVDKRLFKTNWIFYPYIELYKSMKKWLESEAEE
mgnify:FL=1